MALSEKGHGLALMVNTKLTTAEVSTRTFPPRTLRRIRGDANKITSAVEAIPEAENAKTMKGATF